MDFPIIATLMTHNSISHSSLMIRRYSCSHLSLPDRHFQHFTTLNNSIQKHGINQSASRTAMADNTEIRLSLHYVKYRYICPTDKVNSSS